MSFFQIGQTVDVCLELDEPPLRTENGAIVPPAYKVNPGPRPSSSGAQSSTETEHYTTSVFVWKPGKIVFIGDNPDTGEWELIVESRRTIDPRHPEKLTEQGLCGDADPCYFIFKDHELDKVRIPPEIQFRRLVQQAEEMEEVGQVTTTYLYQHP
jgi:hypothetical protein